MPDVASITPQRFADRHEAGRLLAARLAGYGPDRPVVLALPRGGVPVAYEVARALSAPLDVVVVGKLGVPSQPELAMGAVGEGGVRVLNNDVLSSVRLGPSEVDRVESAARSEIDRRARAFRAGRDALDVADRVVIVVDDGVATGATAKAALAVVRAQGARRVVLAVPVGAPSALADLAGWADEVVCLSAPADLWAVGAWYRDFRQVPDEVVVDLLGRARRPQGECPGTGPCSAFERTEHTLHCDGQDLGATVAVPPNARAWVVFVHGSGSSRHSPRNRSVADRLGAAGFATMLVDLLSPAEAADHDRVFDIALLARRVDAAVDWLANRAGATAAALPIGLFGASTGAAAALVAAARGRHRIFAVVSRGGRPDLAAATLPDVVAPTLLIVGSRDDVVLGLNRRAMARLAGPAKLHIVAGATHLFEEPGALEEVAAVAADWFRAALAGGPGPTQPPAE